MCGMQVRYSTPRRSLQLLRVWALTRHSRAVLAKRAAELRGARQAVGLQTEGKHHAGMYQHLSPYDGHRTSMLIAPSGRVGAISG
jgi:hypothetical protein